MYWEASHYIQLIIALSVGIMLFVAAYGLPAHKVMWALLLLIPVQLIDSKYGSINMVLTYMVGAAFLLRGRFVRMPLIGLVMLIMFAYFMSLTQAHAGTMRIHLLYLVTITSNFILFYLVYNFVRSRNDARQMWAILAAINVVVLIYCALEMVAGSAGMRLFGLAEWEIRSSRADYGRLNGPFRATAMTAEYLGIQALICIYALMRSRDRHSTLLWSALLLGNFGFMIATGNRGGIVSLVVGLAVFLFLFRKELGAVKIVAWTLSGAVLFAISAFVMVQYTQYNVLFERLESTEFQGVIPDTRVGWVGLWDEVISKPVFGHGPRLGIDAETAKRIPGYAAIPYPHNAYLYLIYTVGFVGLVAYLLFFFALVRQYWQAARSRAAEEAFLRGLPRLGIAILVLFAVSEMRMEMFRFNLHAYQQYLFALTGAFLAFAHLARAVNARDGVRRTSEESRGSGRILGYKRPR